MSQLLGASRMSNQFSAGAMADEKLQQMLALYKSPATIRDMKQTFFYVDAEASTTRLNPLNLFYNYAGKPPPATLFNYDVKQIYYDRIGTTRTFDISSKIHDLIDIRVPKDKYVVEINLVECVIEGDPSGYMSIPDTIVARFQNDPNAVWAEQSTYNHTVLDSTFNADVPPKKVLLSNIVQATKQVQPQTLYVKIREMANGEPFNWSVTNSGSYSIDKSHQLMVRHGDVNYANLTLEFGHMAFTGIDRNRENQITDPSKNSLHQLNENFQHLGLNNATPLNYNKNTYEQSKYFDYNLEVYNTITSTIEGDEYFDGKVANFYKGDGGIDWGVNQSYNGGTDLKLIPAQNIIQPSDRAFARYIQYEAGVTENPYWIQGKPLFYNQQSSKIGFRFMVRIIHLF